MSFKGYKHSEKTKRKISLATQGKKSTWYGKHHTRETKNKIGLARRGEKHPMWGKHHTRAIKLKISIANKGKFMGKDHHRWKGGISVNHGYKSIYKPDHPYRNHDNYVLEHRLVMEKHLGRYLKPDEIIHHIDGNKLNNNIKNLILINNSEHAKTYKNLVIENQLLRNIIIKLKFKK